MIQKKENCDTCNKQMPLEYMVQKYQDVKTVHECKECKNKRIGWDKDPLFNFVNEINPTQKQTTRLKRLVKWALG